MSKKKFALIIIVDIFIVVALAIFGFKMYEKHKFSLEYVEELIKSAKINTNNIYYKEESIPEKANENTIYSTLEIYYKDKKVYMKTGPETSDFVYERIDYPEELMKIEIVHFSKRISKTPIKQDEIVLSFNFAKNNFELEKELHNDYEHRSNYKYHGKEILDGKEHIKISFTDYYKDEIERTYYYIDIENNVITKTEDWKGTDIRNLERLLTKIYTFESNTVTDNDFPIFDKNNYPDYIYSEYNSETGIMEEK